MLYLDANNFRSLRRVSLRDNGRLTIIVGYNEAGKSSFCEAIKFAHTREAFGLKGKDVEQLVTYGETRLSVSCRINNIIASQTTTTGDTQQAIANQLGVTKDVLPLLFDRKACGDGGNKHMRAFLSGVGANQFNPVVAFANDNEVMPFIELALRAGKSDAKAMAKFCEDTRAAQKAPPRPTPPTSMEMTEEALLAAENTIRQTEALIAKANAEIIEVRSISSAASSCLVHLRQLDEYEKAKAAAATVDVLGNKRAALQRLAGCNEQALLFCYESLVAADVTLASEQITFSDAIAIFKRARDAAQLRLTQNPPPPSMPVMPLLPVIAQETWNKLSVDSKPPAAEELTKLMAAAATRSAELEANLRQFKETLAQQQNLSREGRRVQGAWQAYRTALPNYEQNCAQAEAMWAKWDHAAKAIAAKELEFLNSSADVFATIVSDMGADVLQGRKLRIDREDGIFLDNTPISSLSESTQWRMEVCIMAAIGRLLKSPILLIDGADICDINNRNLLLQFMQKHIVPYFQHCVVTMTATKTLEEEAKLPEGTRGVSKWVLFDGELQFHSGEPPEPQQNVPPPPPPQNDTMRNLTAGYRPPPPPRR